MNRDVKDKIVIVTGGGEGLGLKHSEHFLKNGAKVVLILDVNEELGTAAAKDLSSKYGDGKAVFIKCDVTKDLEKVSSDIIRTYKNVDILINNAGRVREDSARATFDLNVIALIEWTEEFLKHMRTDQGGKGGTIINISSIYGYRIVPFSSLYVASKHAVLAYSKSKGHVRTFEKTGVRIIALCPGFARTNLIKNGRTDTNDPDVVEYMREVIWTEPEAIGAASVQIFKRADSGTAWLIEGENPVEEIKT